MKTYLEWWDTFQGEEIIGIDQDGIDKNYLEYSQNEIENLISDGLTESIERNFKQFCCWMNSGDYVIIGTGQQTKFNIYEKNFYFIRTFLCFVCIRTRRCSFKYQRSIFKKRIT